MPFMDTRISELVERVRAGEPGAASLLREALGEGAAAEVLMELAADEHQRIRLAALTTSVGRTEPELIEAITRLAADPAAEVVQPQADPVDEPAQPPRLRRGRRHPARAQRTGHIDRLRPEPPTGHVRSKNAGRPGLAHFTPSD